MLQVQEYCDLGTLGGIASSWDMQQECDEQMLERLVLLRDTAQGLEALHANGGSQLTRQGESSSRSSHKGERSDLSGRP